MDDETRAAIRAALARADEAVTAGREAMMSIVPAVQEAARGFADLGAAFADVRLPNLSGLRFTGSGLAAIEWMDA